MYLNKILICLLIFLVSCGQIKNRKAEIDSKNIKKENYYIIIASFKNEINANDYSIHIDTTYKVNTNYKKIGKFYRVIIDSVDDQKELTKSKILYSILLKMNSIMIIKNE